MKKVTSGLIVLIYVITCCLISGINFTFATDPPTVFTLYSSNPAGIVDPATGVIGSNGKITGAPKGLIGGSTVNGTNGTASIDVMTDNTLVATGSGACWGKNAVKFSGSCLNGSVAFTPSASLVSGKLTTLVYNAEVGAVNYNPAVSATVTYNGGQTETKQLVAQYEYTTANGNTNGQVIPKTIGTYSNVESVKIFISAGSGDTFLYSVQFSAVPAPSPLPSIAPYTLYSSNPAGIVDPATGVIGSNGRITGAPKGLIGGSTVNGTNGTASIDVMTDNTLVATGSGACWGKNAVKFSGSCLNGSVTFTPSASLTLGRQTTLVYNAEVGAVNYNPAVSATVTYNGGQTETKQLVAQYEYTTANGNTNGQVIPKTIGTYSNVESVKIFISAGSGDTFLYSVQFAPGGASAPTSTPSPTPYSWVNPNDYPVNRICVVQPAYTSTITGNTEIVICARGFTQVVAKCWKQGTGYGTNQTVATVNLDSRGVGGFVFPASQYPHGPITVVISGSAGSLVDECNLQLYNNAGVSWNEGLSTAPVPPQINGLGLSVVYSDDFTNSDLSIHWNNPAKKYLSHKPGGGDFSGIPFRDYDYTYPPFSQVDTYMRIRADQPHNSTGLISSVHHNGAGFAVKAPAYFECKFIAQNAKGTWPAFWTLTNNKRSQFVGYTDELDIIEAYGFDSTQPQFATHSGYVATCHNWGQTPRSDPHISVNMKNLGGGGMWHQGFHTYGVLITATDTIYYCDNIEVWRHATLPVSKVDYHLFIINLAVGGSSGWPYDLSRYDGLADMYVDWVRVYGLPQNVQVN